MFFAARDDQQAPEAGDDDDDDEPATTSASQANPQSASSSRGQRSTGGQPKKMKTLRDLQAGDDDDEEDEKKQDMFAGGEKSGLAVQEPGAGGGPRDHFRNIMNQARQNRDRPPGAGDEEEEEEPQSSNFTGRAQTLGGEDAPSQVVEDPLAAARARQQRAPRVTRTLHLWADGVSIDDGPLLRFDDPANEHVMQEINQGRAPKALLDVQPDQEVDLNLEPHKGENYVAPKPKYKPFSGAGQRLGSPTPGLASTSASASTSQAPAAAASSASSSSSSSAKPQEMAIDASQPTIQLQIRLGDGTRLSSRFNTTHTIGDVYDFVNQASPSSQQRAYALSTTFPTKELDDKSQVLGDISDFKRGGVVVQKWK